MTPELKNRINQFRKDGKNLFSTSEAIVIGLTHPDLYQRLMPERYKDSPSEAYHRVLDGDQRMMVMGRWA